MFNVYSLSMTWKHRVRCDSPTLRGGFRGQVIWERNVPRRNQGGRSRTGKRETLRLVFQKVPMESRLTLIPHGTLACQASTSASRNLRRGSWAVMLPHKSIRCWLRATSGQVNLRYVYISENWGKASPGAQERLSKSHRGRSLKQKHPGKTSKGT